MSTRTSAARWSAVSCSRRGHQALAAPAVRAGSAPPANRRPAALLRSRSSGSGWALRRFILRSRSRQALTTTRCSQVVTCASPRKLPARRNAAMYASCRASAASSGLRITRSAMAQRRSWWRPTSTANAAGSPPRCASSSSRSVGRGGGEESSGAEGRAQHEGGHPPSLQHLDLVDTAPVALPLLRQ